MEFLDPEKKKQKLRRLFIGYGLIMVLVGLATYILIATALGYEVLQSNGQLTQNGLVFIDSHPVSATVFLDGKEEDDKTESKLAVREGEHEITLRADGYRDWTKRVHVQGGRVKFINYPRLYPSNLTAKDVKVISANTGFTTQSPDMRWVIVQTNKNIPSIDIFDFNDPKLPSVSVVLPPTILINESGSFGVFAALEWADDSRHLLISQTLLDGRVNFIILDRENIDASVNLNSLFSIDPSRVTFHNEKPDKLYFYFASGGLVRTADLRTRTVGEPILSQVLTFQPYGDNIIAYTTPKGAQTGKVSANVYDGGKEYLLGETVFDAANHYYLDVAEYEGDWFFAVGSRSTDKVQVYKNPKNFAKNDIIKSPTVLTTLRPGIPDFVRFSKEERFLMAQSGQTISVYDPKDKESLRYDLSSKLDEGSTVAWVDDFRFQTVSEGKVFVYEYDGKNGRDLQTSKSTSLGFFDKDLERLLTITPATDSSLVQETALTVKK